MLFNPMIRRAALVSELIDYEAISRDRLDEALRRACPCLVALCDRADAPFTCRQLALLMMARMPDCHDIGVSELIVARLRWSFPDAAMEKLPKDLFVETTSSIDVLVGGALVQTLRLRSVLKLMPLDLWVKHCAERIESGTWQFDIALSVQEGTAHSWADFYEQEGEALLPSWPVSVDEN